MVHRSSEAKRTETPNRNSRDVDLDEIRNKFCLACGKHPPNDPDHIKTRGAGGGDQKWNVWPLCREHHRERHDKGVMHMSVKYERCWNWLWKHGWNYDPIREKWASPKNKEQ